MYGVRGFYFSVVLLFWVGVVLVCCCVYLFWSVIMLFVCIDFCKGKFVDYL